MLLRLIPPNPSQMTVTFRVETKPRLPDGVNLPPAWTAQLQKVMGDDLESPEHIHALDKSAWGVSLLHEVTFNAHLQFVKLVYVDGFEETWPIADYRCLLKLRDVVQDINTSFHSADQERERDRSKDIGFFPFSRPSSPALSIGKPKQHKRSRSFLMTLVSALVPSSRPSSPVQPEFTEVVPPRRESEDTPNTDQRGVLKRTPELSRSRLLRRNARAALIDAFRLYILPHMQNPFPLGGYPFWAVRSALFKVESRMSDLESEGIDIIPLLPPSPSTSPSLVSVSPFTDDNDSDTDGSSVHTPQDSFAEPPFYYQPNINGEDPFIDLESGLPRTPSPPKTPPMSLPSNMHSGSAHTGPAAEFLRLQQRANHLHAMYAKSVALMEEAEMENRTLLTILEIKSRRRAWSNISLMGRSGSELSGLGTPSRSSPLARMSPTTPETLANERRERHRLSTISETSSFPEDVDSDEDYLLDSCPFTRPALLSCIPFPNTEDFCSTAPQDPLPLFGPSDCPIDLPSAFRADPCNPPIPLDPHPNDLNLSSQSDEFTLALDLKARPRGHRRVGATQLYERDGWICAGPIPC